MINFQSGKNPHCIKLLVHILVLTIFQSSLAWAVSPVPGSLAVLEPGIPSPEMRAAWDELRAGIYLDPLLLVKGREEVLNDLDAWRLAADSIRSSYEAADSMALERVQVLIGRAWAFYYQFDFKQAEKALNESEEILITPGNSALRKRIMFEVLVLKGIVARAAGKEDHRKWFAQAAALDPQRDLPPEKYSPETISIYNEVHAEVSSENKVRILVEGTPSDAFLTFDGVAADSERPELGYSVLPGLHFLEVSASGYEPYGLVVQAQRFKESRIRFELVPMGPEGDTDGFFLQRALAGDSSYLSILAEKLDVDYILIPDPGEGVLKAWLIDKQGRTVDYSILWEPGTARETGSERVFALLGPIRQELSRSWNTTGAPMSFPAPGRELPGEHDDAEQGSFWKKYALPLGIILLIAAAAEDQSGSTKIEATW